MISLPGGGARGGGPRGGPSLGGPRMGGAPINNAHYMIVIIALHHRNIEIILLLRF